MRHVPTQFASAHAIPHFVVVLAFSVLDPIACNAGQLTLAWNANTQPAVAGYMLYYGQVSRSYTGKIDVGQNTTYTVTGLLDAQTYYFAATDYDLSRTESGFSNEVSAVVPSPTSPAPPPPPGRHRWHR
jgi:hypothetical protein